MYTRRAISVFMVLVTIITIASFGYAEEPVSPGGPVDFTYTDLVAASLSLRPARNVERHHVRRCTVGNAHRSILVGRH